MDLTHPGHLWSWQRCIQPHGRFRGNPRFTERVPGTWSSLSCLSTHCGPLNSGDRRGLHLTVPMTAPLHPSNQLSFLSPSPGDSCHKSSLSPNPHPLPSPSTRPPSHSRSLFSPSPSPAHRASGTSSPHLWPLTQHLHCLRRSPEDLAWSLHSAGHLSPAHTQVSVLKSW